MNRSKGLLLSMLFLLFGSTSFTQSHTFESSYNGHIYNKWTLRLMGGPAVFLGDIKQNPLLPSSSPFNEWRFGGAFDVEYRMSRIFSLSGNALYTQLAGSKTKANNYFEADLIEGSLNLQVYPVNIFSSGNGRIAELRIFGGFGLTNFDSRLYNSTNDQVLASSGYGNGKGLAGKTLEPVVRAGVAVDFPIGDRWMISVESSNKILGSDVLDVFTSGFKYDIYNFTAVGIAYKFGKTTAKKQPSKGMPSEKIVNDIPAFSQPAQAEIPDVQEPVADLPSINQVITIEDDTVTPAIDTLSTIEETKPIDIEPLQSGYRVQLLASNKPYEIGKLAAKTGIPVEAIEESMFNNLYIYVTGWHTDRNSAMAAMKQIRAEHATPDAFIVYFNEGLRTAKFPDQK